MTRILMILILGFSLLNIPSAFADGNRFGVQFGSEVDFGGVYYGKDNLWAAGGKMGYEEMETEVNGMKLDTDSLTYSIFIRKNWKIKEATYFGIGVWAGWQDGEMRSTINNANVVLDVEEWKIAPYLNIDYHLNEDFILNAGATIANFKFMDINHKDTLISETDTVEYMKPYLVLTYLF